MRLFAKVLALSAVATLSAMLCLSGCSQAGSPSSAKVEQRAIPLVLQREKDLAPEESEVNLYFVNGGDVPYVALSEFMPLYGSLYESEDAGTLAAEFAITCEKGIYVAKRTDNESRMLFSPEEDLIEFTNYDAFVQAPGDTLLVGLVRIGEDGTGGVSRLMKTGESSYDLQGDVISFDLSKYDIDIVEANDECFVPLQTLHDILLARNYFYTVYNGEKLFVFAYGSELNDQIYTAEPGQMSESFAYFNYSELLFLLDNFYGLKPEHNIDEFYTLVYNSGLNDDLMGYDPTAFDAALDKLASIYLDDLHSGFVHGSVLSGASAGDDDLGELESLDDLEGMDGSEGLEETEGTDSAEPASGASSDTHTSNLFSYRTDRERFNPSMDALSMESAYEYKEVGDTAIVTFDEFSADKKDYYADADLKDPQDTIELVAAAHKQITRESSPIKNVMLDLSCNGGGDADAAAFVIAWFTGGKQVGMRDTLTGAQSVVSYEADVNLDGEFDEKDSLAPQAKTHQLNLYCLISPNSFSCGNLLPAALKGAYGVTLIGQTSGGGSCVVLPCTTASGAQFQISGTSQISTIKNGSFCNADTGITPDVPITSTDTMYDRKKLVEFIHGLS